MSQYGDPQSNSRPPFRRHTPGTNGFGPQPSVDQPLPNLRLPQPPRPTPETDSGSGTNSAWQARRRSEWREHQQLSTSGLTPPAPGNGANPNAVTGLGNGLGNGLGSGPDNGARPGRKPLHLPSPPPHPTSQSQPRPQPPQEPRPAIRPLRGDQRPPATESRSLGAPTPRTSVPRDLPPRDGASRYGLGRSQPMPLGDRMGQERISYDRNSKVTPLRRRSQPPLPGDRLPGDSSPQTSSAAPNAPAPTPRRKTRKAPLPVLYAIRLLIVGVGVAAIAGTVLSALSPSDVNLATATATAQQSTAPGSSMLGLRGQKQASIDSVRLTDEITRLKTELEQLGTLAPGLTAEAFAVDLETGKYVDLNGSQPMAAASTIKVPILVAFLQAVDAGTVSLNQAMVMQAQDIVGESGNMQYQPPGTQYTALDVATQMIVHSDNTATNMMINLLGGTEALNQQFQAWGMTATVLRNPLPDLPGTNTTSPRDLAMLMALVDQGDVLSLRSRDRLLSIMQRTVTRTLIPAALEEGTLVANKTGDIATSLGDVALVDTMLGRRYVVSVLVKRPDNDGRAGELIRRFAERVNKEFNQPLAPSGGAAVLTRPASPGTTPAQPGFTDSTRESGYPTQQPAYPNRPGTAPDGRDPMNSYPSGAPTSPGMVSPDGTSPAVPPADPSGTRGDRVPQG